MEAMSRPSAIRRRASAFLESVRGAYAAQTLRSYREMLEMLAREVESMGLDPDLRRWREPEILRMREAYLKRYAPKTTAKKFVVLKDRKSIV